ISCSHSCCVVLVQVMAQRALDDTMELMANAMAQEAVSGTADRVAQEARRGGEDELRLCKTRKFHSTLV
ncbi:hypothetical protein A2U01_0079571, partial [Trifolium medium]|nr:hypothetical protein [Trifolium medium]